MWLDGVDASIHRTVFVVFVQTVTAMVSPVCDACHEPTQLPTDLVIDPALLTVSGCRPRCPSQPCPAAVGQPPVPPP